MTKNHNNPADNIPSPGVLICDHFYQPRGYEVIRTAGAKNWLITYTLSGEGKFTLNDHIQIVKAGDMTLLKPDIVHQYETNNDHWEFVWAHFLPRTSWIELLNLPDKTKGLLFTSINETELKKRIIGCFQRMIRDNRGIEAFSLELSMNALEEILLTTNQWLQNSTKLDPRVQKVMHILSDRLKEHHTIDSLAKEVCLSPSRLSHLFRDQVGNTIMATLLAMRLRHAARLLEFTNLSITEIASDVGFKSPFYFTKQFTFHFGINPSTYRKNILIKLE
ncbi:AraC family transcriptional regulator of arabinose operon [Evansella vedderi]|uniref:AraC family transcriptional regulator of arabinose operon n=1 Tax=Evansella vedderi TaxID=38282 RepID=A0ABT9ZQ20_9BACI|nr:helix-turn-helix domain-containing protein [Evansella vedderi]MDQ0253341.1 AraC family transcriptional regulator of arabinose operon [Evansella vedderi]